MAGLTRSAIDARRRRGDLVPRHHGVYMLGRTGLGRYGETWAAALAAAGRGALGRWSAIAALDGAGWPDPPQLVLAGGPQRLRGVDWRRTRSLPPSDVYVDAAGLAFTWWPRTLTDLAATASVTELQGVLDRLERRGLLDLPVLEEAIARGRGRAGLRKLRRALEPYTSIPEAEYLSLLERFSAMVLHPAGLTDHEVNGAVLLGNGRAIRVDILFRTARVAVEVDGRDSHDRSSQFVADRERDRELQKLGYATPRFAWTDVVRRPQVMLADIAACLAGRV